MNPFLFRLYGEKNVMCACFWGCTFSSAVVPPCDWQRREFDQALTALNARYILELMYRVPLSIPRPGFFRNKQLGHNKKDSLVDRFPFLPVKSLHFVDEFPDFSPCSGIFVVSRNPCGIRETRSPSTLGTMSLPSSSWLSL